MQGTPPAGTLRDAPSPSFAQPQGPAVVAANAEATHPLAFETPPFDGVSASSRPLPLLSLREAQDDGAQRLANRPVVIHFAQQGRDAQAAGAGMSCTRREGLQMVLTGPVYSVAGVVLGEINMSLRPTMSEVTFNALAGVSVLVVTAGFGTFLVGLLALCDRRRRG